MSNWTYYRDVGAAIATYRDVPGYQTPIVDTAVSIKYGDDPIKYPNGGKEFWTTGGEIIRAWVYRVSSDPTEGAVPIVSKVDVGSAMTSQETVPQIGEPATSVSTGTRESVEAVMLPTRAAPLPAPSMPSGITIAVGALAAFAVAYMVFK